MPSAELRTPPRKHRFTAYFGTFTVLTPPSKTPSLISNLIEAESDLTSGLLRFLPGSIFTGRPILPIPRTVSISQFFIQYQHSLEHLFFWLGIGSSKTAYFRP